MRVVNDIFLDLEMELFGKTDISCVQFCYKKVAAAIGNKEMTPNTEFIITTNSLVERSVLFFIPYSPFQRQACYMMRFWIMLIFAILDNHN